MEHPRPTIEAPSGQVRILIRTRTHLVPGTDRGDKLAFIKNKVCQQLWNRNCDRNQERFYTHNDLFGLDDRQCFFMIDHFGEDHTAKVPPSGPVSYLLTGREILFQISREIPRKIQKQLDKWPFTWEGRERRRFAKRPDGTYDPVIFRSIVRFNLQLGNPVLDDHIRFVRDHPEHVAWIKRHLKEHLWLMLEPYCSMPDAINQLKTEND